MALESDVAGAVAGGGLASDAIAPGARPSARGSLGAENRGSVIRRSVCSHICPPHFVACPAGRCIRSSRLVEQWTSRWASSLSFEYREYPSITSPRTSVPTLFSTYARSEQSVEACRMSQSLDEAVNPGLYRVSSEPRGSPRRKQNNAHLCCRAGLRGPESPECSPLSVRACA